MQPGRCMLAPAIVALLLPLAAASGNGYHVDYANPTEVMGVKSPLDALSGLSSGFTLAAWLRYRDPSPNQNTNDINLMPNMDDNFFNGFGGPGNSYILASEDSYNRFQPASEFANWHHYAITLNQTAKVLFYYIDGVRVGRRQVDDYLWLDDWHTNSNLTLAIGRFCYNPSTLNSIRECLEVRTFFGQIDDVAFFVGPLSDAEVAAKWNVSLSVRLAANLEPTLALFFDFNDPPTTSDGGEIANLGTGGASYNLLLGRVDHRPATSSGSYRDPTRPKPVPFVAPAFVAAAPIPHKAAEPAGTPLVVYARAGEVVDLSAHGLAAGSTYTAPTPFTAREVVTVDSTSVHALPMLPPQPLAATFRDLTTSEDVPLLIKFLPGAGHTWRDGYTAVIVAPPTKGRLYAQRTRTARDFSTPLQVGSTVDFPSQIAVMVPDMNGAGTPFDTIGIMLRLKGTDPPVDTGLFNYTISVTPLNDLPLVTSTTVSFDEDSRTDGVELTLNLTDAEIGQVLAGQVTRLPTKGSLYVVNASGGRTRIDSAYNAFDVGHPVLLQYVERVLRVSSFWGSNPPYTGYHALGIIGPPDCKEAQISNECTPDQPWVGDSTVYPELNVHVNFNGHMGYVRAVHPQNATVDLEMLQYYRKSASGKWDAPCYMDPLLTGAAVVAYPDGCLLDTDGGGLNTAHGRSSLRNVPRASITGLRAMVWCPALKNYVGDTLLEGGGPFGSQYAYSHRQSDVYKGPLPYTEFIEVAVKTPVYIFGVVVGMSRGPGTIVAIRARVPSATPGSVGEWVSLYEGAPLRSEFEKQVKSGKYYQWSPSICRTQFKTDTLRIEIDTSKETGVGDAWNYMDYIQVLGSLTIQKNQLRGDSLLLQRSGSVTTVMQQLKVVYVPQPHANGVDSFE